MGKEDKDAMSQRWDMAMRNSKYLGYTIGKKGGHQDSS
jgi:phage terminase large subunit-like protein